jgi:hypothetical protein
LVADLASGQSAGENHTFYITTAGVTSSGADTGETITSSYDSDAKQTLSVGSAGVNILPDSSRPEADILIGEKTSTLAVFKVSENTNVEDLDVDRITVSVTGGDKINTVYLYDGDTLLGARPGNKYVAFNLTDGTVSIPANGNKKFTVKAKINNVDGTTLTNGTNVKAQLADGSVETTGIMSGSAVDSTTQTATGNTHYVYESRPYFAVNSSSPSGDLFPNANDLLAIFDVTADDGDDISFTHAAGNFLTVQFSAYVADTAQNQISFVLKDANGNTLDSTQADVSSYSTTINDSVAFYFATNSFTVPAGQTKQLYVYADTTDFEDDGDQIQLWIDDAAAHISWGINSSGAYNHGDIIFRGELYGGSHVNPS